MRCVVRLWHSVSGLSEDEESSGTQFTAKALLNTALFANGLVRLFDHLSHWPLTTAD